MNAETLPDHLYVGLGRRQLYFTFVEQSLRTEFLHTDEIVQEWRKTLSLLEASFRPIYHLAERTELQHLPVIEQARLNVPSFKNRFFDSLILLDGKGTPPNKLYGFLERMKEMRAGLQVWREDLIADPRHRIDPRQDPNWPNAYFDDPLARSVLDLLQQELDRSLLELEGGSEIEICKRLRLIYSYLYYTAAVRPDEWSDDLHRRVFELHRKALEVVPCGLPYDSILARRDTLRRFDHLRFEDFAAAVVS